MKTELFYLLLTAVLTGSLWIPVVVGYVTSRGFLKPTDYVVAPTLPEWVNRANRTHMNAVESFAPFAAVVLIAHTMGVSTTATQIAAAVYFFARAAHAVVQISGFNLLMARTGIFSIGWTAFMVIAVELLRHGF